jgi:hypothetical protein
VGLVVAAAQLLLIRQAARVLLGRGTRAVALPGTHRQFLAVVAAAQARWARRAGQLAATAAQDLRHQSPDRPLPMLAAAAAAHLLELLELAVAVAAARGA